MNIPHAIRLLQDVCAVKHLALNTEQSSAQWLRRCATFLRVKKAHAVGTTEQYIEAFLPNRHWFAPFVIS